MPYPANFCLSRGIQQVRRQKPIESLVLYCFLYQISSSQYIFSSSLAVLSWFSFPILLFILVLLLGQIKPSYNQNERVLFARQGSFIKLIEWQTRYSIIVQVCSDISASSRELQCMYILPGCRRWMTMILIASLLIVSSLKCWQSELMQTNFQNNKKFIFRKRNKSRKGVSVVCLLDAKMWVTD